MILTLLACVPDGAKSTAEPVFPEVYTAETDVEDYEAVRFETETWVPVEDIVETLLYAEKSILHRPGAPVESVEHFELMRAQIPPLGSGTQLDFVGDVMWVGGNWADFLDPAAPLLDGDVRIANLETPVDPSQPTDRESLPLYGFNAPPDILDGLPFDVLQLNNNHTLDMGNSGVLATLSEVEARGFAHTGVDGHLLRDGIAYLSFTWGLNVRDTTPDNELFIVPFGHIGTTIALDTVQSAIEHARAHAASVVVMLHWGFEYEYFPDPHFMVLARQIISFGADLVVGQGPHVVQPPEICTVNSGTPAIGTCAVSDATGEPRTAAILYSLGNFGTVMETLPCQVGIIASVTLDPDVTGLGWQAVWSEPLAEGVSVQPVADHLDNADVLAEVQRLDTHLGTSWKR